MRPQRPLARRAPGKIVPAAGHRRFHAVAEVVPPLHHGTQWIDVVAAGPSVEVRARLPLSWQGHP
jgi:hypothetical protein